MAVIIEGSTAMKIVVNELLRKGNLKYSGTYLTTNTLNPYRNEKKNRKCKKKELASDQLEKFK